MFYTQCVGLLRASNGPADNRTDRHIDCLAPNRGQWALPTDTDDTMRRTPFAAVLLWLAAVAATTGRLAAQQQPPPSTIEFSARSVEIDGYLQHGQELEGQHRWGEALAHYEQGLRQFPQADLLERRFELARLHYDLGRRYADRSFSERISRLPADKALELYQQVLLKIQTHYVEQPAWKDLVVRGTADLETALAEPIFVQRNLPSDNRAAIDAFRRELSAALSERTVASRDDARDCAVVAANLAQQRLGLSQAVVILEYLCGAANSLDPYSTFLTPDQLSEVYSQIDGSFVGLGVELKAQGGELVIVRVITGSPAEQAGVRAGDRIRAVDGRLTSNYTTDQAANLLQGPAGSVCALALAAPGEAQRQVAVRRQRVEVPSVDQVRILDPQQGVAFLRLTCFQKSTRRDLEAALWRLHREGMRSLIIDLRGNPGGLLISSVDVADLFLPQGVIVSTHGRIAQEDSTYTAHEEQKWSVPLTLIIDQESASAAEIFSGAIREHHRGKVVGVRSFGKGSVQGIFQLEGTDAGLRLTTAKFYSPTGKPYSRVGVEPDVEVHQAARPVNGALAVKDDAMLAAALAIAQKAALPK
jgi:carboxyl-terminal processing protease